MISSNRLSVRILDLYFQEPEPQYVKADIIRYNQVPTAVPGAQCASFSTIVVDLAFTETELFSNLKHHTRQKIRRTQRDKLAYQYSDHPSSDVVSTFADHLDRCRDLKALPRANRKRLAILAEHRALDISWIRDTSGAILCVSSYVVTPFRLRGLFAGAIYRTTSDPTRRTLIGRANRLLYWRDMLRFKESGFRFFDFGGYYVGNDDEEKLRINGFKEEFGGKIVHEFNCARAITLKGKFILWAMLHRTDWLAKRRKLATVIRADGHESSIPASV